MDALGGVSHYLGVRRRLLLVLVGIVSPVYLAVFVSELSAEQVEVAELTYALVTPSLVIGGVVLLLRRPGNPIGELLVATGMAALVLPAIIEALTVWASERSGAEAWMWAAVCSSQTAGNAGIVLATTLVVLLPDGRFRYLRERRYIAGVSIVIAIPTLLALSNEFVVTSQFSFEALSGIRNPLFIRALEPYGPIMVTLYALASLVFLGAIALLFARYRAASAREQKQIRWVLLAGSVAGLLGLAPLILGELGLIPRPGPSETALTVLSTVPIVLLPASIVVAVMEPPWIDVDIVIRRSVVYGALSLVILLVYIAVAASVGMAAGAQLGLSIELAVVLSVVTALPARPTSSPGRRGPLGVRCAAHQVRSGDRLRGDDRAGHRTRRASPTTRRNDQESPSAHVGDGLARRRLAGHRRIRQSGARPAPAPRSRG